jgi:hypothetical protein
MSPASTRELASASSCIKVALHETRKAASLQNTAHPQLQRERNASKKYEEMAEEVERLNDIQ